MGDNMRLANAELTFNQIMEADGGAKLLEGHRKIGVLHLPSQRGLQVVAPAPWRIEIPLTAGNEERREKREPSGPAGDARGLGGAFARPAAEAPRT